MLLTLFKNHWQCQAPVYEPMVVLTKLLCVGKSFGRYFKKTLRVPWYCQKNLSKWLSKKVRKCRVRLWSKNDNRHESQLKRAKKLDDLVPMPAWTKEIFKKQKLGWQTKNRCWKIYATECVYDLDKMIPKGYWRYVRICPCMSCRFRYNATPNYDIPFAHQDHVRASKDSLQHLDSKLQISMKLSTCPRCVRYQCRCLASHIPSSLIGRVYNGSIQDLFRSSDYQPEIFLTQPIKGNLPWEWVIKIVGRGSSAWIKWTIRPVIPFLESYLCDGRNGVRQTHRDSRLWLIAMRTVRTRITQTSGLHGLWRCALVVSAQWPKHSWRCG